MTGETMRTQLEMTEERVREIEGLMREYDIRTKKEFFNYALTLLKWAIGEIKDGRIVASIDEKNNRIKEIDLTIFDAVRRQKKGEL